MKNFRESGWRHCGHKAAMPAGNNRRCQVPASPDYRHVDVRTGYDIPDLLTGRLNQHPSAAIDYTKEQRTDYADFYTDLLDK